MALEFLAGLKDLAIAGAAVTTAIVAVKGLQRWRQELEGRAHFDVARGLARATYRLRDELQNCRSPFYLAQEFPEGYKGGLDGQPAEEVSKAWAHVFSKRWAPVWTALQDFDAQSLEAEALWGQVIRSKTKELRQCVRELDVAITTFLRDKASGGEDFAANREFGRQVHAVVAASIGDESNPLNQKIATAVIGIEGELSKHLRRG